MQDAEHRCDCTLKPASAISPVPGQVLTLPLYHSLVQGAQPMDIDGGQAAGGSWLHDGAAGQDMADSSQLSPEDEELLALASAPLSQPEADAGAAHDTAAEPPQELSQISPEDGELLALANEPLSQAELIPAQNIAPQQSEGPSQISPEDEELLALVDAQPSQQGGVQGAAGAGCAQMVQESPQLDPEDEELLALASAFPTQPESTFIARPAAEREAARPGNAPSQLSPEDEELLALAAAPTSQLQPAATAPETQAEPPQGSTDAGTGSQAVISGNSTLPAESHATPTQVLSLESPVECSGMQPACGAVQLNAALQPETMSVAASMSADDEELTSLAANSWSHPGRAVMASQRDSRCSGDSLVPGEMHLAESVAEL